MTVTVETQLLLNGGGYLSPYQTNRKRNGSDWINDSEERSGDSGCDVKEQDKSTNLLVDLSCSFDPICP